MALRPRATGAVRTSAGSKLARSVPMGIGLRPPSGSGVRKPSPQPTESITRPAAGRIAGQGRTPTKSATPSEALNGDRTMEVGDRVVVNGMSGKLAFLGATQFARGIWAGIVLDTQDGKNNGIVNGVQYFECGPNKGLFSKPEKLTIVPKSSSSPENKPRSHHSTSHSPSLAQHTPTPGSFKVGDRVSLDGAKEGVIGFMGETQFARGTWVGVILDTPDGKNNGCVNGVQYFECGPNRGLFAKPEKLTIISRVTPGTPTKPSSLPPTSSLVQNAPSAGHFEIGDRVLVDSLKEGVVGFLGETQFARGLWAGVILDAPEGKNDGLVNGVRYFTCEPNHGIFTRLNKLEIISRASQDELHGSSNTPIQDGGGRGVRSDQLTPVNLKVLQEKLKVGDHVLVGGMKEGILRFLGPTEFARGIWVGVELPEPLGKNDGAISGKRYFQCESKHGLFAPLPKVEKLANAGSEGGLSSNSSRLSGSPSSHASSKTGSLHSHQQEPASMVYEAPLLAGSLPRNSSLSSSDSSRISQDQFLPDDNYQSDLLGMSLEDLSQLVLERDEEIETLHVTLDQREKEKQAHQEELTELRRQVDDLQFQLEEQNVISGDQLETATESSVNTLAKVTHQLEEEKKITTQLQGQIKAVVPDGDATLEHKMADLQARLEESKQEVSSYQTTIAELRQGVEQARKTTEKDQVPSSSDKEVELAQMLELERNRSYSLENELAGQRSEAEARCATLAWELEQLKDTLKKENRTIHSLEQELSEAVTLAGDLQGDLERSQRELLDNMDLYNKQEALAEERGRELSAVEEKLRHLMMAQELWSGERSRLQSEQQRLIGERDKAFDDNDHFMSATAHASSEQNVLSQQRKGLMSERDGLLAQQQALQTEYDKIASVRDELLHQLNEVQQQKQDILGASQQMGLKFTASQGELSQAMTELELARSNLTSSLDEWEHQKLSLIEEVELARASAVEAKQQFSSTASERDSTLVVAQEMADRLEQVQSERDGLQIDLETSQVQVEELQFQLDELDTRHLSLEQETNSQVQSLQHRAENLEVVLEEKERELAVAQEKANSLSDDFLASQGTRDLAMVEEEKMLLEERVKELILQLDRPPAQDKLDSSSFLVKNSTKNIQSESLSIRLEEVQTQLLEAEFYQKELLQRIEDHMQQADFLNSVIADLQNKLEGVEAMKGLHGHMSISDYPVVDDEDELQGLPPPRMFCDICDTFDLHDTDDCPLQATSSVSPQNTMYHSTKAPGGSDRPYCDNCEVFGHWTSECEFEATY